MAPPKIIITKKEEPCEVYFPRPVMLSEKIQGHIIEQNNPPVRKANKAICPDPNIPTNIAITPKKLKIPIILRALSFAY